MMSISSVVTVSTTRSLRMSSPSFLSSPQPAMNCRTSWSLCKPTGVLLVCRGCQEKVLSSLVPADADALQGSFSSALPFSTAAFEWPCQLLSLSLGPTASCPSPASPHRWFTDPSETVRYLLLSSKANWSLSPWLQFFIWGLQLQEWSIDNEFWGCFMPMVSCY